MKTLWVFGYGSLMWDPGFAFAERVPARLEGWHRSFCMASIHYRGTPERPGLVLALDAAEGAVCDGVAYGVSAEHADATHAYLRERELISYAYDERFVPLTLADGRRVEALTYVINREHEQYRGAETREAQAGVIATAVGQRGPNADYLFNTVDHLRALGIEDADLDWLAARVRAALNRG
ncbi:MAG: gamma-glutamylcyclotransferase [Rhodobacteraceae bacterium]|nr:gamma-glutamylcyclotransferase [Paracoccaceae bacterium]